MNKTVNPKEIDHALADNYEKRARLNQQIASLRYQIAQPGTYIYPKNKIELLQEKVDALLAQVAEHNATIRELEAQYTGWTRAYLVMNSNGHIHKSTDCQTCFETTQYYWMTELSGETELDIATLAGEKACTICYSDAPSAVFLMKSKLEHPDVTAARAEREAKKAEREAKRLKTGIWMPDGTPLKVKSYSNSRYYSEVKAERTASSMLVDALVSLEQWIERLSDERYGNAQTEVDHEREVIALISMALATKRGTSAEEQIAIAQTKADKRIAEQKRYHEQWLRENPQYAK